ncbi:MAG: sensor histidine kinase [Flavobacterium sp.]
MNWRYFPFNAQKLPFTASENDFAANSKFSPLAARHYFTGFPLRIQAGYCTVACLALYILWENTAAIGFIFASAALFYTVLNKYVQSGINTKDTEINMLKSQFSPHFLFNSLNIIYGKFHSTSPEAAAMVQNLAAFMRYLSYDCSSEKVLLQKEIAMLHDYIKLYKMNYTDSLNITFMHKLYDPGQKAAPMILLNFVENAFKHSNIAAKKDAYVNIELATDRDTLHFKVTNNKAPVVNQLEKGIGNTITLRQLEIMYGGRYEYNVRDTEKEYEVFLKIRL